MTPLGLQSAACVCPDSECLLGCLCTCSNHVKGRTTIPPLQEVYRKPWSSDTWAEAAWPDRNGARSSGHQTSRPLTHCHPAMCPWVPSVRWVRDTSVPPNCRHGKSQWQHTERFAGVNTINHMPVQGDGPQHPRPAICLSIRGHVLLYQGCLLTYLTDIFSPSPSLQGP